MNKRKLPSSATVRKTGERNNVWDDDTDKDSEGMTFFNDRKEQMQELGMEKGMGDGMDVQENKIEGHPGTYTIQEAIDHVGFGWFQIKLSILAGICWMADSMEMMMLAILGPILHCEWFLSSWEQALLSTLVMVGMTCSSSLWGVFCDKYGRKTALVFSSILCGYYGALTAISPRYEWVAICRFLVGTSVGALPQTSTLYSEYLPTKSRATLMVCLEMFFSIGAGFEVLVAMIIIPPLGWRYLLAASALPSLIFACLSYYLPESARYQLACGDYEAAVNTLEKVALENKTSLPEGKLEAMDNVLIERGHVKDLLRPSYRLLTFVTCSCWFLVGFCYFGIALLVPTLFSYPDGCHGSDSEDDDKDDCHVECEAFTNKDYKDLVITAFADIPGLAFVIMLMNVVGRKASIAISCFLFSAFVLLANICASRAVLTFLLFSARALITGAFQAVYVFTSEAYPTQIRAVAVGCGSGLARFGAVITPYLAQVGTKKNAYIGISGYGLMGFFAACAPLLLPIETKGRAMKEAGKDEGDYVRLDGVDKT